MKADIHPSDYRLVVFQDLNNDASFLVKSAARTKETIKYSDGQTYPLVKLHITSASHPFYTGQEKVIDVEGRIDKFQNRKQAAEQAQQRLQAKSLKNLKRSAAREEEEARKKKPKVSGGRVRAESKSAKSAAEKSATKDSKV